MLQEKIDDFSILEEILEMEKALDSLNEESFNASRSPNDEVGQVGKVRNLHVENGSLKIFTTDRLSAFDQAYGSCPLKGQLLTLYSVYWFQKMRDWGMPSHYLGRVGPQSIRCRKLEPVKIEVVVRASLLGSMWEKYQEGKRRFFESVLPDGLKYNEMLPEPVCTPFFKAPIYEHDYPFENRPEMLAKTGITSQQWDLIEDQAKQFFVRSFELYQNKAKIHLMDTKYEFGLGPDGPVVMDEVNSPDSSRLWDIETAKNFDKDFIRSRLKKDPTQLRFEERLHLSQLYLIPLKRLVEASE